MKYLTSAALSGHIRRFYEIIVCVCGSYYPVMRYEYSDTSANKDNSFRSHIR